MNKPFLVGNADAPTGFLWLWDHVGTQSWLRAGLRWRLWGLKLGLLKQANNAIIVSRQGWTRTYALHIQCNWEKLHFFPIAIKSRVQILQNMTNILNPSKPNIYSGKQAVVCNNVAFMFYSTPSQSTYLNHSVSLELNTSFFW